ncbi:hypothetical protein [Ktedonospora formicarum]|uniref:Uncharacterized protein n=1 Tax=Ktedonospora formicarum TaxID=2778364 RepID=A0A8J3MR45_9CHLR|nr:hypothetical protein [Ktedonospora formicarum]GHO45537.1 hypothetical protein KSX_37000 [Ktedonospora formicarum]
MQERKLNRVLSKDQLLTFFGLPASSKIAKKELLKQLVQLFETNLQERDRLLRMFANELAVEPTEAQALLQCTASERRRWIEEGRLPVLAYRQFEKWGRTINYPVHDRLTLMNISQDDIMSWRNEHLASVEQKRSDGNQRALISREANKLAREEQRESWEHMLAQWQAQGSPELTATLELAYWTVWCSRWAKQNQLKKTHAIKYAALYQQRKEAWYQRKNIAMLLLAQTPLARLSFYRPPEPHKYSLWLCESHNKDRHEGFYESAWEYAAIHKQAIKACSQCTYTEIQDYYSLYLLEIQPSDFSDLTFSFHMPYPLGKKHFPVPSTLPRRTHVEQEGSFRFGRALLPGEQITHREEEVLAHFKAAHNRLQQWYPLDNGTNDTLEDNKDDVH